MAAQHPAAYRLTYASQPHYQPQQPPTTPQAIAEYYRRNPPLSCAPLGARLTPDGCLANQVLAEAAAKQVLGFHTSGAREFKNRIPTLTDEGLTRLVACSRCGMCIVPEVRVAHDRLMQMTRQTLVEFEARALEPKTLEQVRDRDREYHREYEERREREGRGRRGRAKNSNQPHSQPQQP